MSIEGPRPVYRRAIKRIMIRSEQVRKHSAGTGQTKDGKTSTNSLSRRTVCVCRQPSRRHLGQHRLRSRPVNLPQIRAIENSVSQSELSCPRRTLRPRQIRQIEASVKTRSCKLRVLKTGATQINPFKINSHHGRSGEIRW